MKDAERPDRMRNLVDSLLTAPGGKKLARARGWITASDPAEAAAALIEAMRNAEDPRTFSRAATLLAEIGGDAAAEALALHARTQRRYPRLAVRALGACDHPSAEAVLLDLLEFGRIKQRRAAAFALSRRVSAKAVEPLCRMATHKEKGIAPEAREALMRMGPAVAVAGRVLDEPEMTVRERVRTLLAMEILPVVRLGLRVGWFDAERYLEREAARSNSTVRMSAQQAYDLLKAQRTLLRAAPTQDNATLLRAASGVGVTSGDGLLRMAFGLPAQVGERLRPTGLLARLWFAIKALLSHKTEVEED